LDESWITAAARAAEGRDRDFVSSPFAAEVARVQRDQGVAGRAAFLRGVLRVLAERGRPGIATLVVPDAVKVLIEREYQRIEKDFETASDEHYDLGRHDMRCDFRIVGFGRLPMGTGDIEVGGVPRHLLWSGGAAQAWWTAALLTRAGGREPFYVAHFTHRIGRATFVRAFNLETLAQSHLNVAGCMRMNPHIRGFLATSWWYDPQLARVAPHLNFLREGSLSHGAVLLRSGATAGARKLALTRSKTRQQAFDAGEYVPTNYSVVWPRETLIAWADSVDGGRSQP